MLTWLWTILTVGCEAAAVVAILSILRRPREPRAMLAWILALLLLPGLGLVLFLALGEPRRDWHRFRRRRSRRRIRAVSADPTHPPQAKYFFTPAEAPEGLQPLVKLTDRLAASFPIGGNVVTLYYDADETYDQLEAAIRGARSHVHLEYYIFQPDQTGRRFRALLIEKAREGVHCRLLLDFVGCWRLSRRFIQPLKDAGVQVAFCLPVVPWRSRWRANFRNHRKIAVIDGQIGFTGSQNIGDEYRGRKRRKYGPWRDTHLRIVGPGVRDLQEVFARDWHYTTKKSLLDDRHFPRTEAAGSHVVQVVPSGPDQREDVMHQLLFAAVSAARESISIITPYFVPDRAMILALRSAAFRGVQVRLLVPACSDHRIVLWAGRSFYKDLIGSGVQIYEHDHTMLHSKVMVIDRSWAMVGSANVDERSFRVNFELTTILYSTDLADDLYRDFETLRAQSRHIKRRSVSSRSTGESLLLGLARLASPLL
ncbi:MAG TPA: cardiolipin synthase [Phycisphaerae bacterium]|nr:cardiolipin synthase [Phycisphaerae bacterium]HRY68020.1 cardiolipin synthase [Phycisphaerae bacterium]HSA26757.1 cardiolipin synthase [Phycisphaerae bacterium]